IGFDEPTYDERRYAAAAARRFGTEHHETVVRGEDAAGLLPEVARVFDEPFADASSLPAVLLSRLAREQVTVVLSGDGGDELFCGYPTQTAHRAAEAYGRLPRLARRAVAAAAEWLPTSHRYLSFDFALRRFLRDAARPAIERHLRWMGSFPPEGQARLLAAEAQREARLADPYATAREAVAAWGPETASDVATALDLLFYLADDNLVQADRASMSVALEVRAPFLDRAVAEYALRLPAVLRRGLWSDEAAAPARRRPRGPALGLATRPARLLGHRGDVRRAGPRDGAHRRLGHAPDERRALPHQAAARVLARGERHGARRPDGARPRRAYARRARHRAGDGRPRDGPLRRGCRAGSGSRPGHDGGLPARGAAAPCRHAPRPGGQHHALVLRSPPPWWRLGGGAQPVDGGRPRSARQ